MRQNSDKKAVAVADRRDMMQASPAPSANSITSPPAPPAEAVTANYSAVAPLLRLLPWRGHLTACANMLGARVRGVVDDDPQAGAGAAPKGRPSAIKSRDAALAALGDLHESGKLAAMARALESWREPADPMAVFRQVALMQSMAGGQRAAGANFATAVACEVELIGSSIGALTLACRDAAISPDRKFGPPELGELLQHVERREGELAEIADALSFLTPLAPQAVTIREREKAERLAEMRPEIERAKEMVLRSEFLGATVPVEAIEAAQAELQAEQSADPQAFARRLKEIRLPLAVAILRERQCDEFSRWEAARRFGDDLTREALAIVGGEP